MGTPAYPSSYRGTGADLRMAGPSGPVRTYRLSQEELAELEARLPRRPEKRPRFTLGQWSRRSAQEVDDVSEARASEEPQAKAETPAQPAQTPELTRETIAQLLREHPEWTGADLSRHFGLTAGTFYDAVSKRGISLRALRRELRLPNPTNPTGRMPGRDQPAQDRRPAAAVSVTAPSERYEMQGRLPLGRLAERLRALEAALGAGAMAQVHLTIRAGED